MNGSVSFFGGAFVVPADFWYYWRIIVSIGVVTLAYAVWHEKMKTFVFALIIACLLSLSGCGVSQFTAETEVSFKNGEWYYKSNKNQQDLAAEIGTDKEGHPYGKIKTTSSTPESAIAAALETNRVALQLLQDAIKAGAAAGNRATIP